MTALLVGCFACGGSPPSAQSVAGGELRPVPEVHRNEDSGIAEARTWILHDSAEWEALWGQTTAEGRWSGPQPEVDLSREMLVAVAAGMGSSDRPAVSFDGYRTTADTMFVFIRRVIPGEDCSAADDVARLLVVGRLPRHDGPVLFVTRRAVRNC